MGLMWFYGWLRCVTPSHHQPTVIQKERLQHCILTFVPLPSAHSCFWRECEELNSQIDVMDCSGKPLNNLERPTGLLSPPRCAERTRLCGRFLNFVWQLGLLRSYRDPLLPPTPRPSSEELLRSECRGGERKITLIESWKEKDFSCEQDQPTATHNHRGAVRGAGSLDEKPHGILHVLSHWLKLPSARNSYENDYLTNRGPVPCFKPAYVNRQTS